jgi:hypothetical protein
VKAVSTERSDQVRVFLRLDGNDEFEIGVFTRAERPSGTVLVIDYNRPLAGLLRRVADVIEADGELPVEADS